jgi:hypothetical protein
MSTENEVKKYVQFYSTALGKKYWNKKSLILIIKVWNVFFVLEGKKDDG